MKSNRDANMHRLEELKQLTYKIRMVQKGALYYGMVSELSLTIADKDPKVVLDGLEAAKVEYFQKMIAADAVDDIPLPEGRKNSDEFLFQMKIFVAKIVVVCLLFGGTTVFVAAMVRDKIAAFATGRFANDVLYSFTNQLNNFATMPKERYEGMRLRLKESLILLRPMVAEIYDTFQMPPVQPAAKEKTFEVGDKK